MNLRVRHHVVVEIGPAVFVAVPCSLPVATISSKSSNAPAAAAAAATAAAAAAAAAAAVAAAVFASQRHICKQQQDLVCSIKILLLYAWHIAEQQMLVDPLHSQCSRMKRPPSCADAAVCRRTVRVILLHILICPSSIH